MEKSKLKEDRCYISTDVPVSPLYGKPGNAGIQTSPTHLQILAEWVSKEYIFANFASKKTIFNSRKKVLTKLMLFIKLMFMFRTWGASEK